MVDWPMVVREAPDDVRIRAKELLRQWKEAVETSEIIDRYKLRDPQYKAGSRAYGVPRPVIFILDKTGTVKSKLYEETYQKRPPATLVLATLDKVASGK